MDVALEEMIQRGSVSVSQDSVVYETNESGAIVRAMEGSWEKQLDAIGADLSGEVLWSGGGATLLWDEARWQLTPIITTALEMDGFKLQHFDANLRGEIRSALVPRFNYSASASVSNTKPLASARKIVLLGYVAVPPLVVLPVWLDLKFNLAANFTASASVQATMAGGVRQNLDFGFGGSYTRGASPAVVDFHQSLRCGMGGEISRGFANQEASPKHRRGGREFRQSRGGCRWTGGSQIPVVSQRNSNSGRNGQPVAPRTHHLWQDRHLFRPGKLERAIPFRTVRQIITSLPSGLTKRRIITATT